MKNATGPDHPFAGLYERSHRLLRVTEAVNSEEAKSVVGDLYTEVGTRIHHGQDLEFDPAEALAAIGLDQRFATAADDTSWDETIAAEMAVGLALTGDDVGTPLIGFDDLEGNPVWDLRAGDLSSPRRGGRFATVGWCRRRGHDSRVLGSEADQNRDGRRWLPGPGVR
jgi:hypothetical protein